MAKGFRCSRGHIFEPDEAKRRRYIGGEIELFCPVCDDDDLENVYTCAKCGKWFEPGELFGNASDGSYCVDCLKSAATVDSALAVGERNPMQINGIVEQFLTKEEAEAILFEAIGKLVGDEKIKDEAREYCMADPEAFAEMVYTEAIA